MLDKIRQSSNSFITKLILSIIALSFIGIGGASFINRNNQTIMIKFDHAEAISAEEFELNKAKEIELIQKQNSINLTPQQIEDPSLNKMIIERLIHNRMLKYLTNKYDLELSEEKIINFIKQIPYFKDQEGKFDPAIFKRIFANSAQREQEYIDSVKEQTLSSMLYNVFVNNFKPTKLMQNNLVNYLAESRIVDVISVPIDAKPETYQKKEINLNIIDNFYQQNKALFTTIEKRNFDYIIFDQPYWQKKLEISEIELKNYFAENMDQFSTTDFSTVREEILTEITNYKTEELIAELSKNLEEDLASGANLTELSQKYHLKLMTEKDISLAEMSNHGNYIYREISDNIFELANGETSYPIELTEQNTLIIAEIKSLTPAKQLKLENVIVEIEKLLAIKDLEKHNFQNLEQFKASYQINQYDKSSAIANKITINEKQTYTRLESSTTNENQLPTNLVKSLFKIEKNNTTPIFSDGKKLYFAYLRNITVNLEQIKQLNTQKREDYFARIAQEAILEELILYLTKENNIKFMQQKAY